MITGIKSTSRARIAYRQQPFASRPSINVLLADVCIFLVTALSIAEWWQLSRMRFIAIIAAAGLFFLWNQSRPTHKELSLITAFILCHSGILIAVSLYGEVSELIYHFGLAFCVFPFMQAYLNRRGISTPFVYAIVLSALPNLLPQFFSDPSQSRVDMVSSITQQSRLTGLTGDPNYTALGLAAPFAAVLFLSYSQSGTRKFLWVLLSIALALSIMITGSRAGLAAVICAFFLYILFSDNPVKKILPYLVLIPIVGLAASPIIQWYLDLMYRRTEGTLSGFFADTRYEVWAEALKIILDSPPINFVSQEIFMGYFRIVVHNFLLDIGLTYGSLTMFIHLIVLMVGTLILVHRYRISSKFGITVQKKRYIFMGLTGISVLVCMATLTVGTTTIYWWLYSLIWCICFSSKRLTTSGVDNPGQCTKDDNGVLHIQNANRALQQHWRR